MTRAQLVSSYAPLRHLESTASSARFRLLNGAINRRQQKHELFCLIKLILFCLSAAQEARKTLMHRQRAIKTFDNLFVAYSLLD
jgi:hypothetical protein